MLDLRKDTFSIVNWIKCTTILHKSKSISSATIAIKQIFQDFNSTCTTLQLKGWEPDIRDYISYDNSKQANHCKQAIKILKNSWIKYE